jgi:hypothetical protein
MLGMGSRDGTLIEMADAIHHHYLVALLMSKNAHGMSRILFREFWTCLNIIAIEDNHVVRF